MLIVSVPRKNHYIVCITAKYRKAAVSREGHGGANQTLSLFDQFTYVFDLFIKQLFRDIECFFE